MTEAPRPPAHLSGYVEILGVDQTVQLLLELGGSAVYFAENPKGRGALERVVGRDKAAELCRMGADTVRRIPTGKPWLAQVMKSKGLPVSEIARRLHTTDVTIRKYLRNVPPAQDPRQPSLL